MALSFIGQALDNPKWALGTVGPRVRRRLQRSRGPGHRGQGLRRGPQSNQGPRQGLQAVRERVCRRTKRAGRHHSEHRVGGAGRSQGGNSIGLKIAQNIAKIVAQKGSWKGHARVHILFWHFESIERVHRSAKRFFLGCVLRYSPLSRPLCRSFFLIWITYTNHSLKYDLNQNFPIKNARDLSNHDHNHQSCYAVLGHEIYSLNDNVMLKWNTSIITWMNG